MNRRDFLRLSAMALAGEGARRMWPFRMYSFPTKPKAPYFWNLEEPLTYLVSANTNGTLLSLPRIIVSRYAPLDRIYLLPKEALTSPPRLVWHEGPPQPEPGLFDYLKKFDNQIAMITGVAPPPAKS